MEHRRDSTETTGDLRPFRSARRWIGKIVGVQPYPEPLLRLGRRPGPSDPVVEPPVTSYEFEALDGLARVCVCNLGPKNIAGFSFELLISVQRMIVLAARSEVAV